MSTFNPCLSNILNIFIKLEFISYYLPFLEFFYIALGYICPTHWEGKQDTIIMVGHERFYFSTVLNCTTLLLL